MSKTVVGLLDDRYKAKSIVTELVDAGFDRSDISLVASDTRGEYVTTTGAGDTSSGALTGAGIGAAFGGIGGLVAGLAGLAIPGIGPIIAAGPLAAALAGAGAGAVAGGLIGALTNAGVPKEEAEYYAEGVRRGGVLVTVKTNDDMADVAANVLHNHSAVDIDERATAWRGKGWSRFDETAPAYSDDEIARERKAYSTGADLVATRDEVARATARKYDVQAEMPAERMGAESSELRRTDPSIAAAEQALRDRGIHPSSEAPLTSQPPTPEPIGSGTSSDKTIGHRTRDNKEEMERSARKVADDLGIRGGSQRAAYTGVERRKNTGAVYAGVERRVA